MMLPRIVPVSPTTMPALRSMVTRMLLPAVLPVLVIPLAPKMLTGVPDGTVNLGASLRDRAYPAEPAKAVSALRAGIPRASAPFGRCALRLPGGSLRSPPLPVRHRRRHHRRHRSLDRRMLLASALRAVLVAVLASLALAGCASCGQRLGPSRQHSVRRRCPLRRAPHYAVQSCPHQCGHFRPSLRQRAAHDCLRLRPHRRPLTRRGGSPPPGPPASIPQTSMLPIRPSRPPGRPWFSHPTHRRCRHRGGCPWPRLADYAPGLAHFRPLLSAPDMPGKAATDQWREPPFLWRPYRRNINSL